MKFTYAPVSYGGYIMLEPRVPVVLTNLASGKSLSLKALVDSGAARTVLHPDLAEVLSVELPRLATLLVSGADHDSRGYDFALRVYLAGDARHEFLIPCAFFPGLHTDAALGWDLFFDRYRIVFEQYRFQFQITPRV
jgi:Aspartyl protease